MSELQVRKAKLPHTVIVKAPSLFNMEYKPSELAKDLNIPERTMRDWLAAGAPHMRDSRNHLWVNGKEFAKWVEAQRKVKASGQKLADNEAYCLRCKQPVALMNPVTNHVKGKLIRIKGNCPVCGCVICRGGRNA